MKNTGSIFGSKKDIQSADYAIYQAIAEQNLNALKTIGLIVAQRTNKI